MVGRRQPEPARPAPVLQLATTGTDTAATDEHGGSSAQPSAAPDTATDTATDTGDVPMHPGAEAYFDEAA